MTNRLTRRRLITKGAQVLAVGTVLPAIGACGGKKELSCMDTSGLNTADKQLRTSLAYVDKSQHGEAKNCLNCQFFQSAGDSACGTCTLVKGPIHPLGYCNSWAAKAS